MVQTDFTAFYDGVVLKSSNKMRTNWEDYYRVRPTDLVVTLSQQRPQTLRDSYIIRTTVKPQAPPQEKNIQPGDARPGDYI